MSVRSGLSFLYLILLALLCACAPAFAQSPLERAVTLARQRNYAEAAAAIKGVPEPELPQQRIAYHRLKAAIASGLGQAAEAAAQMESALDIAPADQALAAATAVAELNANLFDLALVHAQQASGAASQKLIGDIQEKRGNYVAAAKAYRNAVELEPASEEYRIRLALEFIQHYTFEPALTILDDAAAQFPKSAKILTLLGVVQYAIRKSDEATGTLTRAVDLAPSSGAARRYLTIVVLDSTAAPPPHTVDLFCHAPDQEEDGEIVCAALKLRVAREQNDSGLLSESITKLHNAPAGNAVARCELGRYYQSSGEWQEARREMEACVALDPSDRNHYRLGLAYSALGLTDLAREQMKLREEAATKMAAENARRSEAVQAFQYVLK